MRDDLTSAICHRAGNGGSGYRVRHKLEQILFIPTPVDADVAVSARATLALIGWGTALASSTVSPTGRVRFNFGALTCRAARASSLSVTSSDF